MPVNSEKLVGPPDPNADVKEYTSKILGINNGGKADGVADLTSEKYETTVVTLREYNTKYGLCSENALANQWYLDTKIDIEDTNMRAQMEAVLTNDRLSQNQKIESQYDILQKKLTGKDATPEDKSKWELIAKDKKEIDEKYSTKKVAPKDGKASEKIVKTCKMPAGFDNCVGKGAVDIENAKNKKFTDRTGMYAEINKNNNTKIDFDFITAQENGDNPPSTTGYIPWGKEAKDNKSGVTVGTGFDIGQMNHKDFDKYKFPKGINDKLRGFVGLKQQEACNEFARKPKGPEEEKDLTTIPLTDDEVLLIDKAKFNQVTEQTKDQWNKLNPKTKFEDLDANRQTVLASRAMQYGKGSINSKNPFISAAIQDDWNLAQQEFKTSGSYGTRREAEKGLLEESLKNKKK